MHTVGNTHINLRYIAETTGFGCYSTDFTLFTFTKPPLFRRNRLTGSGNPSFESHVEGKAQQRENEGYIRSSFQIAYDCTLFTEEQLIRTGLVLWF